MSRGPGHVERAIEAAFTAEPERIFTVDDLCRIAYPNEVGSWRLDGDGSRRPPEKRRRSVLRAAAKVAKRMGWRHWRAAKLGHPVHFGDDGHYRRRIAEEAKRLGMRAAVPGSKLQVPTAKQLERQAAKAERDRIRLGMKQELLEDFHRLEAEHEKLQMEADEKLAAMELIVQMASIMPPAQ